MQEVAQAVPGELPVGVRLGLDIVQVSQVAQAIDRFGDAYEARLFTSGERAYAHSGAGMVPERLAARFAAKEAVIKALQLGNAGVNWRDIEVLKRDDGDCGIQLHGRAAAIADRLGVERVLLSLSHDGDYAGAVATAHFSNAVETTNFKP